MDTIIGEIYQDYAEKSSTGARFNLMIKKYRHDN